MLYTRARRLVAIITVCVAISGCAGSVAPLRQVVLSPPPVASMATPESEWEVRRVRVPEYLDSYDVQLRTEDYLLARLPNAKWAERLPVAMTRLLQNTIDAALDARRGRDYEVDVWVETFEPQATGEVVLAARWRVVDSADESVVARNATVIRRPLPGEPGDAGLIGRTMSNAVQALADQIVAESR